MAPTEAWVSHLRDQETDVKSRPSKMSFSKKSLPSISKPSTHLMSDSKFHEVSEIEGGHIPPKFSMRSGQEASGMGRQMSRLCEQMSQLQSFNLQKDRILVREMNK